MANEEHLEILRRGVEVWNRWREENPYKQPDLRKTDLRGMNLSKGDFSDTDLRDANLFQVNLTQSSFFRSDLSSANLTRANLYRAEFVGAKLVNANLSQTNIIVTNFNGADLQAANLTDSIMRFVAFIDTNLALAKGLSTIMHSGPSDIGLNTILRSKGDIPEKFLQGVGLPDSFIKYLPSLISHPIQYYSCFISYSSKDEAFAQRLHADLQQKGVRCWFPLEDMRIGDKIRLRIDESIRIHDKLLLILSEHSINSTWVETEVETAFAEEHKRKQIVLFPVRLDAAVMTTDQAWATHIRNTRHIGDFSRWQDHDAYQGAFERLLRDLKAEG